ncbi:MAG TPA: PQQ-binding-like beta-propeller repeat protein [Ktedonobacterales bacterium]|nr:PQQ-binding-like beta-propeller repeat protein [Ktedonobacterales bacterium]
MAIFSLPERGHNCHAASAAWLVELAAELSRRITTDGTLGTQPALAHGVFYAGSDDNHLYALDAQTGAFIWSRSFPGVVNSNVAIAP